MSSQPPSQEDVAKFAQQLMAATEKQRVIVLNSQSRQSARLLLMLREYYGKDVYFYTSAEEDRYLPEWLLNFANAPGFPLDFGQAIRQELQTVDDPASWGAALAHELNQLCREQTLIVLEHFDVTQNVDALNSFIRALGEQVSPQTRVLITTPLAKSPWLPMIADGMVFHLNEAGDLNQGEDKGHMLQGQLEVYALGGLARVSVDGYPITSWDGSLPRHVFFFFVDRPQVTRQEIFDAFWPELPTKDATNVFHVTKRKISEKLGYDLTLFEGGFYIPNPQLTRFYDVHEFEASVQAAMGTGELQVAEKHWLAALKLYRGHFLKEIKAGWAVQRRQALREMYIQGLSSLGEIYHQQQNYGLALAYLTRATAEAPHREDICRQMMALQAEQGRFDEVAVEYKRLEEHLKNRLNSRPSAETRQTYQQYLQR